LLTSPYVRLNCFSRSVRLMLSEVGRPWGQLVEQVRRMDSGWLWQGNDLPYTTALEQVTIAPLE